VFVFTFCCLLWTITRFVDPCFPSSIDVVLDSRVGNAIYSCRFCSHLETWNAISMLLA
jgi:hypothetical protein